MITCPCCAQVQDISECLLGTLGKTTHLRCRYCGAQFTVDDALEDVSF